MQKGGGRQVHRQIWPQGRKVKISNTGDLSGCSSWAWGPLTLGHPSPLEHLLGASLLSGPG